VRRRGIAASLPEDWERRRKNYGRDAAKIMGEMPHLNNLKSV
jgi:hypothetical protein